MTYEQLASGSGVVHTALSPDRTAYKRKILHGEWTIGTKIPSQRKLAEELQVNRSTVTAAVDELIAQGLLEGKEGRHKSRQQYVEHHGSG